MIPYRNSSPFVHPTKNTSQSNADHITAQENSLHLESQLCTFPLTPIPRWPSKTFTGLYANWKPHPEATFIVAGDLRKVLPKFFQDINCSTRTAKTLDHCFSNFQNAYMPLPGLAFRKSDHDSFLLLPSYRQNLKQEVPVPRTIQHWSDQSESTLQDCFDHVDWDMFRE